MNMGVNDEKLNQSVIKLWEEIVSCPTPQNSTALWKEHQEIRKILQIIENANVDTTNANEQIKNRENSRSSSEIFPNRSNRMDNVREFLDWSRKMGVETNNVKIESFSQKDSKDLDGGVDSTDTEYLGLRATGDILQNEWLVKVPRRAMFCWDDARKSTVMRKLFEVDPMTKGMENVALAVFLVSELIKGAESHWWPYFSILPGKFTTPLFYSEEEMSLLRPSPVFESALKLYRSIVRQFAYFHMIIQRNEQARITRKSKSREAIAEPLLENSNLTISNFTFVIYRWAVACVSTRVNLVPSALTDSSKNSFPVPCLIPFLDMANHAYVDFAVSPESVYYCLEAELAKSIATKNYKSGDEVFMSYGLRSSADHLLHNGFISTMEANPGDFFRLKLGLAKNDKHLPERVQLLHSHGLKPSETFKLVKKSFPPDLFTFVTVFLAENLNDNLDSDENKLKSCKFLLDRLKLLLTSHESVESKIASKIASNEASFHEKSVNQLLANERGILEDNLQLLTDFKNFSDGKNRSHFSS